MSRYTVIYLRAGREHRTAWFTSRERAGRALAVVRRHGYSAAVLVD
jgi:hypothetical protein